MKKSFIQSCMAVIAAGALLIGCNKTETVVVNEPTVAIEVVGSVSLNSITVSMTPSENTTRYDYAISAAGGGQKADFVSGLLAGIPVDGNVPTEDSFNDLEANTYYEIYAMAYDANGAAGPVSTYGFKTVSDDFNVTVYYVSDNSAGFRITRSDDYSSARYALGTPDDLQAFLDGDSSLDATSGTLSDISNDFVQNYFELDPETEYVFYCIGTNRMGKETQVFQVPVTTYAVGASDIPNYEFSIANQDFYLQEFNIARNELCPKAVVGIQPVGQVDAVIFGEDAAWEGKIMDALNTFSNLSTLAQPMKTSICQGSANTVNTYNSSMTLDTELDVYVVAYDMLYAPSMVKKFGVTVPSFNPDVALPDESAISIEITNVTSSQVIYTITYPDDYDANHIRAYRMDFIDPESNDPTDPDQMATIVNAFVTGASNTMAFTYDNPTVSGTFSYTGIDGFVSGATLYLGVLPVNENGFQDGYADAVAYSKPILIP